MKYRRFDSSEIPLCRIDAIIYDHLPVNFFCIVCVCHRVSVCPLSHRPRTVGQFLTWGAQSLSTPAGQEVCNMGTTTPPVLL